jgi:hypothetical protein
MASPLKNVCEELVRMLDHKVASLESIARKLEADTEERFERAGVGRPAHPPSPGPPALSLSLSLCTSTCAAAPPPQVNPVSLLRRIKKLEA